MKGYEHLTLHDIDQRNARVRGETRPRSKYGNVRTIVDGLAFDSQLEASIYSQLRIRERAGEITELRRQVVFPLTCHRADGLAPVVASYVADFCYRDREGVFHVVDAKSPGTKTKTYQLKKRWLFLQDGLAIEEVGG